MERAPVLVIIAVVAAVGLFSLRFLSAPTEDGIGAGAAARRDQPGSSVSQPGYHRGSEGASSGSSTAGSVRERLAAAEPNRRSDASGDSASGSRGSAHTLSAGGGGRGGRVGASTTGRSPGGRGSGASIDAGALAYRKLESNAKRADVVDLLASHPASSRGFGSFGDDRGADSEVALEVRTPEDTDPAIVRREIDAPESSDEGLTFSEQSVLAFPDAGNASGDAGTISFEIEPQWAGAEGSNNSFVQIRGQHQWSDRLELVKNGQYLRFIIADSEGREADISVKIDHWAPGERHDIQASWGDKLTTLWIDGRQVGSNTYSGNLRFPSGTPMYLASDYPGGYSGAKATFRRFKVTTSASHGENG